MNIPAVFINCRTAPFIDDMIGRHKLFETRSRNSLRSVIGKRCLLAETGTGKTLCRASAVIGKPLVVRTREEWNRLRPLHCVPEGSQYDWQPDTKAKYLYPVTGLVAFMPFKLPEGKRHGMVWIECEI